MGKKHTWVKIEEPIILLNNKSILHKLIFIFAK
jgi:hypothetical protein